LIPTSEEFKKEFLTIFWRAKRTGDLTEIIEFFRLNKTRESDNFVIITTSVRLF